MNSRKAAYVILVALVLIGAALRFASIGVPWSHDESSALLRLHYDNFSDLIRHAVYVDGHPAGVQLFLWLWAKLFGYGVVAMRLPFVMMGLACIPLIYDVGRQWFGRRAGLCAAAVVACTQFAVMYSLQVRPYVAGLFAVMVMLDCWSRLLLSARPPHWLVYVVFALSAAACAYIHYYCMLTAFVLGIAGLFYLGSRQQAWRYVGCCVAAVALFVPHLPITIHQLFDMQGVGGWLGKPSFDFFAQFLGYLCHFTPWVPVAFLLLVVASPCSWQTYKQRSKLAITALLVFLALATTGYCYSLFVAPSLQFSTLLFGFPFLVLFACSPVGDDGRPWLHYAALGLYVAVAASTLVFHRQHFEMMKLNTSEPLASTYFQWCEQHGYDSVACVVSPHYLCYYGAADISASPNVLVQEDHSIAKLDSMLRRCDATYVVTAGLWEDEMDLLLHYYPELVSKKQIIGSEVEVWAKSGNAAKPLDRHLRALRSACYDSASAPSAEGVEYYTLLDTTLSAVADDRFQLIATQVDYSLIDTAQSCYLVMEVCRGSSQIDYRSCPLGKPMWHDDGMCVAVLSRRLEQPIKSSLFLGRYTVKVYIWNPSRADAYRLYGYNISASPTNPYVYSHIEEVGY